MGETITRSYRNYIHIIERSYGSSPSLATRCLLSGFLNFTRKRCCLFPYAAQGDKEFNGVGLISAILSRVAGQESPSGPVDSEHLDMQSSICLVGPFPSPQFRNHVLKKPKGLHCCPLCSQCANTGKTVVQVGGANRGGRIVGNNSRGHIRAEEPANLLVANIGCLQLLAWAALEGSHSPTFSYCQLVRATARSLLFGPGVQTAGHEPSTASKQLPLSTCYARF